jgi:hypothetical protein
MNPENGRPWSELIKNYVQIAAIVIGGIWTYRLFIQKDAPGLEARGTTDSYIQVLPTGANDGTREIVFSVRVENKGTSSFDISKIRVRGWEFEFGKASSHLEYFDPKKWQSEKPFFDETYELTAESGPPFPSHYPPGAILTNSFTWLAKPDCGKRVFFQAEFFLKDRKDVPNWFTGTWSSECPDPPNQPPPR